jgi:hypothetical protein
MVRYTPKMIRINTKDQMIGASIMFDKLEKYISEAVEKDGCNTKITHFEWQAVT